MNLPAPRPRVQRCLERRAPRRRRASSRGDYDVAGAGPAVADRDLARWLPEVELTDLPRAVEGALEGALGSEQGAQFAQALIDDRLAAVEAERLNQLTDADRRQPRILAQQPPDLLPEGGLASTGGAGSGRRADARSAELP
jgi:hypothetical protein